MQRHIEALREYLREARVDVVLEPQVQAGGGHRRKAKLLLESGVSVLAKLEDGTAEMARAVRCEEAAFVVAAELGWTDLVAATVQRQIGLLGAEPANAAVQILWPDPGDDAVGLEHFLDGDKWRAAIFDVILEHGDHGHNWAAAPQGIHPPRLRLYDNGFAFGAHGFNSAFYQEKPGQQVPEHLLNAIREFMLAAEASLLPDLLPEGAFEPMLNRARHLVDSGRLELWRPT